MFHMNFSELKNLKKQFQLELQKNVFQETVKEVAEIHKQNLQKYTPVLTGLLRSSWSEPNISINGRFATINIHNPVYYASYVNYGHYNQYGVYVVGRNMLKLSEQELYSFDFKDIETKLINRLRTILDKKV